MPALPPNNYNNIFYTLIPPAICYYDIKYFCNSFHKTNEIILMLWKLQPYFSAWCGTTRLSQSMTAFTVFSQSHAWPTIVDWILIKMYGSSSSI